MDNEEKEDEEKITEEKEPPKQGKEKAKKAEQVYFGVEEKGARIWGCCYYSEQKLTNFCKEGGR